MFFTPEMSINTAFTKTNCLVIYLASIAIKKDYTMRYTLLLLASTSLVFCKEPTSWDTEAYSCSSEEVQKVSTLTCFKNLLELSENDTVIEFGGGDGNFTEWYAQNVKSIIFLEPEKNQIKHAQKRLKNCNNVAYLCSTIEQCTVHYKATKGICTWVLHWVPEQDKKRAITNMYNALEPGGLLYLATMVNSSTFMQTFDYMRNKPAWKNYFTDYKPFFYPPQSQELNKLLSQVGFELSHFEEQVYQDAYPSREILWQQIYSTPFFSCVTDPQDKRTIVDEAIDHYIENFCEVKESGVICSKDPIVIAVCKKQ